MNPTTTTSFEAAAAAAYICCGVSGRDPATRGNRAASKALEELSFTRIFKLVRLAKLLRIMRAGRLLQTFENAYEAGGEREISQSRRRRLPFPRRDTTTRVIFI